MDPYDVGVAERWFEGEPDFPTEMPVPAAWNVHGAEYASEELLQKYVALQLNGKHLPGTVEEQERLFHTYPGPAWYRKTVSIPEAWEGMRPWLVLGGVHRYADVWINGRHMGAHLSYLLPFRIDLSGIARPGDDLDIRVRVDARRNREIDPLMGCMDTLDFLYVSWGGLYRDVVLQATNDSRLESPFIRPDLKNNSAHISVSIVDPGATEGMRLVGEILDRSGTIVARVDEAVGPDQSEVTAVVSIPEPRLWSPDDPHLYQAKLRLEGDGRVLDAQSVRFGMREFEVRGDKFYLNGRPIFLRGYGDDAIFPNTISPPASVDEMRKRLAVAKDYGFNYVRHHSWTPPKEYLEAADELGMLLQVEFPFAYGWDLPTDPKVIQSALDQWRGMILMNRNHPSVVVWCMGNELYDGFPFAGEMYRIAKDLDPTRPVIDTDGFDLRKEPRDTMDFVVGQFVEAFSIGFGDDKYRFSDRYTKPVVAHEMGYFVTLPDLDQLKLFGTGMRPYWLYQTRDLATDKGVMERYPEWLEASYKLQALSLKTNMEAARRSKLSGTSVWLFQDYPNCAEGVVDMFFREKGISAEQFRQFNDKSVLLMDAPRRNWWQGETAEVDVLISRFEDASTTGARLQWQIVAEDRVVQSGEFADLDVVTGGVQHLAKLKIKMPATGKAQKLTLQVRLTDETGRIRNEWDFWSYPPNPAEATDPVVVMESELEPLSKVWPIQPAQSKSEKDPLLIVDKLTPQVLEQLEAGGRVLLLAKGQDFPVEKTNFRLSSWDGGGPSGTVVDMAHPVMRAVPNDGWCDLHFYYLIQGSVTAQLTAMGADVEPIVRCIDRSTRLDHRAYLFEAQVGKGRLLVSTFNFALALEQEDPLSVFLLRELIRYAGGDEFRPTAQLPVSLFDAAE